MIGVYVLRDETGTAIYVGSSGDLDQRLGQHRAQAPWWWEVDSIERIEVDSRALAFFRERALINSLSPKHNTHCVNNAKLRTKEAGPIVRPRPEAMAYLIDTFGSVRALAESLGCNHMTLSDIWRGVHYPSTKVVARLIVVTGIPFEDLFYVDPQDAAPEQWLARRERGAA